MEVLGKIITKVFYLGKEKPMGISGEKATKVFHIDKEKLMVLLGKIIHNVFYLGKIGHNVFYLKRHLEGIWVIMFFTYIYNIK